MRSAIVYTVLMLSFSFGRAQVVQVSEEPRHHKVFQNDRVRVLDVHIPAGDTSLWHKHSTPSVFLILSNTKTGSEVKIEPAKQSFSDGRIWFEGFYDTPRIHRVWNADDHEFHVIDMELPHTPTAVDSPLTGAAFHLLFDEKPVRAYRVTVPGHGTVHGAHRHASVIVVGLEDEQNVRVNDGRVYSKGGFMYIEHGRSFILHNAVKKDAKLAVLELK